MFELFVAAALALTASEADAEYERCIDANTDYVDAEYGRCTQRRIDRADERLNARWEELMGLVGRDSELGQNLVSEERAWIAYKDAACGIYMVEGAGTADRFLFYTSCKLKIIEDRVTALDEIIEYVRGPDTA